MIALIKIFLGMNSPTPEETYAYEIEEAEKEEAEKNKRTKHSELAKVLARSDAQIYYEYTAREAEEYNYLIINTSNNSNIAWLTKNFVPKDGFKCYRWDNLKRSWYRLC